MLCSEATLCLRHEAWTQVLCIAWGRLRRSECFLAILPCQKVTDDDAGAASTEGISTLLQEDSGSHAGGTAVVHCSAGIGRTGDWLSLCASPCCGKQGVQLYCSTSLVAAAPYCQVSSYTLGRRELKLYVPTLNLHLAAAGAFCRVASHAAPDAAAAASRSHSAAAARSKCTVCH